MDKPDNPPARDRGPHAFPLQIPNPEGGTFFDPGMLLRDYFAAAALTGMNATLVETTNWPTADGANLMAEAAYRQADAMLAARQGGGHE